MKKYTQQQWESVSKLVNDKYKGESKRTKRKIKHIILKFKVVNNEK